MCVSLGKGALFLCGVEPAETPAISRSLQHRLDLSSEDSMYIDIPRTTVTEKKRTPLHGRRRYDLLHGIPCVRLCRGNRPQFALIREACQAYGLDMIEGAGYEADDVIASLALEVCCVFFVHDMRHLHRNVHVWFVVAEFENKSVIRAK